MKLTAIKWILPLIIITDFLLFISRSSYASTQAISVGEKLAALEASAGGRIGVYAINTANGSHLQYRSNERFPMGCTSKVIGVAAILNKAKNDDSLLSQHIKYTKKDLSTWSPITEKHLRTGMTVGDLCAASISYSDNTAMNLLVKTMGGLEQMNIFARSIHNDSFRQDNGWPAEAYSGGEGNLNDSSTPKDMANSLHRLAFTDVLTHSQKELLISWLKANTTGNFRIRAGVLKDWVVADKTGTGSVYGTTNDIGIVWPPTCAPIVMTIYFTSNDKNAVKREDVIASATRILINQFAESDECIRKHIS